MKVKITIGCFCLFLILQSCSRKVSMVDVDSQVYIREQTKIKNTLKNIFDFAKQKQLDSVESHHLYGPKFTKFNEGSLSNRQNAETTKEAERQLILALSEFDYMFEDLKIDIFNDSAIATFIMDINFKVGSSKGSTKSRGTIVFVKDEKKWKITHEHFSPFVISK